MNEMPLSRLRELLLKQKPSKEEEARRIGAAAAEKAIQLLVRDRLIPPPELEGYYQHQDTEFKTMLHRITGVLKLEPKVVYNPGCGTHVSLATAYPNARAIFTDTDPTSIGYLKQGRFEAYEADMRAFTLPDGIKADVTMILNAGHMTEHELDRVTALNGIVIINNWHGGASYMDNNTPNYKKISVVCTDPTTINPELLASDTNALHVFQRQN